ncbi:MAG: segregation/condensation protein A [Nevskiaceae bacterium]|nr:MAG: segregation/condensation protein A [Nevskiaceae bacterium]TAM26945.1 MAG: segregation/condensation protein A [Nevskiaceae bacterium]
MSETEASLIEPAPEALAAHPVKVHGQLLEKMPDDLYIPPDALEVVLEAFEGPLDLLLYLIRRQNLDILDIPVLTITKQYVQYIQLMQGLRLELAAEYLVMAALLAEIKSRMLLPKPVAETDEGGDPRMELVRRLQEYERFKTAAENLDGLPRLGRDWHLASAKPEEIKLERPLPTPHLRELLLALRDVLQRAELFSRHQVAREPLSVRERMSRVLEHVKNHGACELRDLVDLSEGKAGVVVVLLAILELTKLALIDLVQDAPFAPVLIDVGRPREGMDADGEWTEEASYE